MMSKLLTAEQLGEIRKRHDSWTEYYRANGLTAPPDQAERRSLFDHIDALQDNMHTFQETIQSAMDEVNS